MGMSENSRSVDDVLQELRTKLMLAETIIEMSLRVSSEVRRTRAAVARELDVLTAAITSVRADLERSY
jgi:hypothetical protein